MNPISQVTAGVYRFSVAAESSGMRLDQFLAQCPGGFSRGLARRLVDLGGVHLDGRRMRRCSQLVVAGQQVEVYVDDQPLDAFALTDAHVLFRDPDLLVINKPAGVATQPTPARYQGTLYAALQRYLEAGARASGRPSLGMVQRLDRDTSGVILFSIHPRAHRGVTKAFQEHRVRKLYHALVAGIPDPSAGEIRTLLARRRATNRMTSVERGGKPAVTRYRVIAELNAASLVEVELETGRSHQIRVHLAELGHPLLGDTAYGGAAAINGTPVPRQMLHAVELALAHPVTGAPLQFAAPYPEDFNRVLAGLQGPADRP